MVRSHFAVILALLALHFCGTTVHANTINEVVDGPISAEIVHVIDGNTILVEASPWPQQTIEVYV